MKSPLGRFDGATEKVTAAAEKVAETFHASMAVLVLVGIAAVAALVIGVIALKK